MSRYGARYIHWAPFATSTPEPAAAYPNYGTKTQLAEMVAVSDTPNFAEGKLYGDDRLVEWVKEFVDGDINVEITHLAGSSAKDIFGLDALDTTDMGYGEDKAPYGGLGFVTCEIRNGVKSFSAVFYPKVKFAPQAAEYNTKNDAITFATGKLTGKIFMCNKGCWKVEPQASFTTLAAAQEWIDEKFDPTPPSPGGGTGDT